MSPAAVPDRFSALPDEHVLQATVVALEEHGFSVASTRGRHSTRSSRSNSSLAGTCGSRSGISR
jgi:hypothetical protein